MRTISCGAFLLLSSVLLVAGQGTVPQAKVTAYPARIEIDGVGLGAALLNDAQVKQRFVTDLGRDFLVVELALYPKAGGSMEVSPDQFSLQVGDERMVRSENPKVIAAYLQKSESGKRDLIVVPEVTVGYETGRGIYDSATGTYRRGGGLYTSTGVIVASEPSSGGNPRNEDTMALELTEKGLPAGNFTKPVAGHLYFRIDKKVLKDARTKCVLGYEISGKPGALGLKR